MYKADRRSQDQFASHFQLNFIANNLILVLEDSDNQSEAHVLLPLLRGNGSFVIIPQIRFLVPIQ